MQDAYLARILGHAIAVNRTLEYKHILMEPPMPVIDVSCPHCFLSSSIVRNGMSQSGYQRYLCRQCNKTFQLRFTQKASEPGTHQKIVSMALNGVGRRATCRIMGISLNTVLRHLKL